MKKTGIYMSKKDDATNLSEVFRAYFKRGKKNHLVVVVLVPSSC